MAARRAQLAAISLCFVLSGFTGLVYETVWFKRLGHAWGNSSFAMASVVATFLAGLGLGAWAFGRVADRSRRPLALYGWFEIAIGVAAFVVPFEIAALTEHAAPLSVSLADQPLLLAAARMGLTFAVIGPPCMLMGATLPLLTRQLASSGEGVGASAAWLYAFNTLGAAAGAWAAGFVLLERFGLPFTNAFAAVTSLAVGGVALAASQKLASPPQASEGPGAARASEVGPGALALAALATGLGSITLQMLWAREVALLVGGTTHAFTATLAVFVFGIGLGSLIFRLRFAGAARTEPVVALAAGLVVVPALAGAWLEPHAAEWIGFLREPRGDGWFNSGVCVLTAASLELLPAIGMGLAFPALVELSSSSAERAGRTVARVYVWNTFGSIAGAATAALVLLPALGGFWSARLALALYALLPVLLFRRGRLALATTIGCAALLFSSWRKRDPIATNAGTYLYGAGVRAELEATMHPVYFAEGASCNVLVLESLRVEGGPDSRGIVNLRINGKIDASNRDDMPMQLGMSYLSRFLRPEARRVLVIGMGSGASTGAAALFPDTEVTVCEIEPAILEASRRFDDVNHRPLERPNVRVASDDGRSFVQGHEGPWDLILSEPTNPWIAGVANLFTQEFYRNAQAKLSREGLLVQWLQTYSFGAEEYALVVRTLQSVFPHTAFLRVSEYDTLLLASNTEILPGAAALDRSQVLADSLSEVAADLDRWFGTRDVRSILLSRLWLDAQGLRRFATAVGGEALNTDANLNLEFAAPRRLFQHPVHPAATTMHLLLGAFDATFQQRLCASWNCGPRQVDAMREMKTDLFRSGNVRQASAIVELALAYEPEDAELLVDKLLFDPALEREEFERISQRVLASSPLEVLRLGQQLGGLGQHNAARVVLEQLTAQHANSATAWVALASALEALGRKDEASAALDKARALDPIHDALRVPR
jgi:predicted membrane-bound spermidine synthase/tetratricopeptide (TPR) repeat protein